ncbi:PREDICTED: uncharacterized protein LOC109238744 [Nicotiana attenuata]|uniref:uncharacterized protein LOC109238744 n=1 Tax=Nicotiana attenuata TaxID=49451 RepID=UPI00090508C4|nr:PREDICTED: uncharacterized protein LOC109238744 [Nicotiana attenuata]
MAANEQPAGVPPVVPAIISFQLTGIENYSLWFRSMRMALLGRNKLGLVDGTCTKENFPENLWNHWERVNAIVLSWLMNSVSNGLLGGIMYASSAKAVWDDLHERFDKVDGSRSYNLHKENTTLSQGTNSFSIYFSKLNDLWEEFEALVPAPGCDCPRSREYVVHLQKLKLFQFLMGLNVSYSQARGQILLMNPMPRVNQAYAMVISDESQKSVAANAGVLGANPTSAINQFDMAMYTKTGGNYQKFKKNFNLFCDVCKMKGHTKESCYRVIGYPPEYRPRKRNTNTHSAYNVLSDMELQGNQSSRGNWNEKCVQNSQLTNNGVSANTSQGCNLMTNTPWMGNCTFTKEQYEHIVQLLNKDHTSAASTTATPSANAVGIPCALLASKSLHEWIIDTGATNHMVADIELLNKVSLMQTNQTKKVHLPNGETTQGTHIGTSTLTDQDTITNVFYIPQFKYNQLSVSKLTKKLKCSVAFFPDFCIFQELFSGRVKAIGKEDSGLYILSRQKISENNAFTLNSNETEINKEVSPTDIELWHRRLGHVSASILKKLFPTNTTDISTRIDLCTTCPCAKQTRQSFPISSIKTVARFELVHMDVWGPYKIPTVNGNKFFLTVVDDFSRKTWIFLLKLKSDKRDRILHRTFILQQPSWLVCGSLCGSQTGSAVA